MSTTDCAAHSEVAAVYRCDGCNRLLCAECVEEGHRLLFCRHCGERALPLDSTGPATAAAARQARVGTQSWAVIDVLRWPLRGQGGYLIGGLAAAYVALAVVSFVLGLLPLLGILGVFLWLAVAILFPGLLIAAARSTADGDNEPPDWPEWGDHGARESEMVAFVLVGIEGLIPMVLLFVLGGCLRSVMQGVALGAHCGWIVTGGMILAVPICLAGLAVVAREQTSLAALRVDLQLRLLLATLPNSLYLATVLAAVLFLGRLTGALLTEVPLLSDALAGAFLAYVLLLTGHLAGLLLRLHPAERRVSA